MIVNFGCTSCSSAGLGGMLSGIGDWTALLFPPLAFFNKTIESGAQVWEAAKTGQWTSGEWNPSGDNNQNLKDTSQNIFGTVAILAAVGIFAYVALNKR